MVPHYPLVPLSILDSLIIRGPGHPEGRLHFPASFIPPQPCDQMQSIRWAHTHGHMTKPSQLDAGTLVHSLFLESSCSMW